MLERQAKTLTCSRPYKSYPLSLLKRKFLNIFNRAHKVSGNLKPAREVKSRNWPTDWFLYRLFYCLSSKTQQPTRELAYFFRALDWAQASTFEHGISLDELWKSLGTSDMNWLAVEMIVNIICRSSTTAKSTKKSVLKRI